MVVHELSTNAGKYGALSVPAGRVAVEWRVASRENGTRWFELDWVERGGPPVRPPQQEGFGSTVVVGESSFSDLSTAFELLLGLRYHMRPVAKRRALTASFSVITIGNSSSNAKSVGSYDT